MSNEPFVDQTFRWKRLTLLQISAGEIELARSTAREVTGSLPFVGMLIDRRFDGVISAEDHARDIRSIFENDIDLLQRNIAANPDLLDGPLELALAHLRIGDANAALSILNAAIDRANTPLNAGRRFSNQDRWINWAYDYRQRALFQLGRYEEALSDARRGASRPEDGNRNVSQTINLAELLLRMGRATEALTVLQDFDDSETSPYGWMNANYVRACANKVIGDLTAAERIAQTMRARSSDSWRVMRETEICMGELDRAAELYIAALHNEDDRAAALWDAQIFQEFGTPTEFEASMNAARRSVIDRRDVQAAVQRFGRVLAVPIEPVAL
ncbi:MAG: hypothetical protein M0D54_01245 [Hyphomonadaceae bacterium JAD_PAG50586_4]|nr:MAG: hypothetical protein M0D54_01245 [Hyphomonadaceae bacterium JAD_PAG50586_4]